MMNRRIQGWLSVVVASSLLVGCLAGEKKLKYLGDADLDYYKDVATEVSHSHTHTATPDSVKFAEEPRRLRRPAKEEVWDMTLAEALQIALENGEILVDDNQVQAQILSAPQAVPSIYDPALQGTNVALGGRGVEAALAEFDSQFTTNMTWGRDEQVQNQPTFGIDQLVHPVLTRETGQFQSSLAKQFGTGGQLTLNHIWNYDANNFSQNQFFPTSYTGSFGLQYRQPLLAGAGTKYTRIAGPINSRTTLQNVPAVNQGVVVARIRSDISIADFEAGVRNLVVSVERAYWNLYLAYRIYHAQIVSRNSALNTWRNVKGRMDEGFEGGAAPAEAQARDNYFETRARAENALAGVYSSERDLRRLLHLAVNDGRIIRPVDEPTTAEFYPDWQMSLVEALSRRVELRRQKWNIKSLALQLEAAESLTRPRLDFVSGYQVNAFGDNLFGFDDDDFFQVPGIADTQTQQGFDSAYESLTQGNQTGWTLGFEFNMPLGFRAAHAQVRNLELRLAKERAVLAEQELQISHELAGTIQELDRAYMTAQTNFNRRRAAQRRVQAFEADFEAGRIPQVDLLLRAQISLAEAENAYFQSLVAYNQAILDFRFQTGMLLEDNNIFLEEGLWDADAYDQALRRAWARSHAFDADHLKTIPGELTMDAPAEKLDLRMPDAYFDGRGMDEHAPGAMPEEGELDPLPPQPLPRPEVPAEPAPKSEGPTADTSQQPEFGRPVQLDTGNAFWADESGDYAAGSTDSADAAFGDRQITPAANVSEFEEP